jgi:hypothetical protein
MEMPPKRVKRKFKTKWVKLDQRWAKALRRPPKSVSAYELAHVILFEAFKCKYTGGDIVLSSAVTGMPRETKIPAANRLAELGLIKIVKDGKHALRVTIIIKKRKRIGTTVPPVGQFGLSVSHR